MEAWMWIIWLAIFVLAIIIETLGTDLISIWFAVGAIIALVISFTGCAWWIQIVIFAVVSLVSILCLRPLAHKYMRNNIVRTNIDEMIHSKGVMKERYDALHHGEVVVNGVTWTAIGQEERDVLEPGDIVTVVGISGNKLIVKLVQKGEKK